MTTSGARLVYAGACSKPGIEGTMVLMTMTRTQISAHAEEFAAWWTRRGMTQVACLTIDPKQWRPKHHSQVVKAVKSTLAKVGFTGYAEGAVERGLDGSWHAHLVFEAGRIKNEDLRSAWYLKQGRAMVRAAGSRTCAQCAEADRPNCTWRKFNPRGCGDLEYVGRKMHRDQRDGGAIIEIDPPTVAAK